MSHILLNIDQCVDTHYAYSVLVYEHMLLASQYSVSLSEAYSLRYRHIDAVSCTGSSLLLLMHTKPNTLTVGRYGAPSQSEQQTNDGAEGPMQWTELALYQRASEPLDREDPSCLFRSDQLMASHDGTQVVLVAGVSGMCS